MTCYVEGVSDMSKEDEYKRLMLDMAKYYFLLREAHCVHVPDEELAEDGLLEMYLDAADYTCNEIRKAHTT